LVHCKGSFKKGDCYGQCNRQQREHGECKWALWLIGLRGEKEFGSAFEIITNKGKGEYYVG
jgi:hypothetical protein